MNVQTSGRKHVAVFCPRQCKLGGWQRHAFSPQTFWLILAFLAGILLWPNGIQAQSEEVRFGFVRDDADATRLIAVAIPNAALENRTVSFNRGAVMTFYLPAGTIDETTPNDLSTSLAFTPLSGTQWHAEVYTNVWMNSLSLDTGGRDAYRFSLTNSILSFNVTEPIPLFAFSLPDGCGGGVAEILSNEDPFAISLLTNYATSIENVFPTVVLPAIEAADLYSGIDALAGSLPCEEVTLAISLVHFSTQADRELVSFAWQTAAESGIAGFNLFAAYHELLEQLNVELIPATGIDSIVPNNYRFVTETAATRFYLEEIYLDGGSVRRGPFSLNEAHGLPTVIGDDIAESTVYLPMIHH